MSSFCSFMELRNKTSGDRGREENEIWRWEDKMLMGITEEGTRLKN